MTSVLPTRSEPFYPRASGGTPMRSSYSALISGLSPRERGNRSPPLTMPQTAGSIPARAGEPPTRLLRSGSLPVYPRASGGTDRVPLVLGANYGLSPRERGNPLRPDRDVLRHRSIPARAGEPG